MAFAKAIPSWRGSSRDNRRSLSDRAHLRLKPGEIGGQRAGGRGNIGLELVRLPGTRPSLPKSWAARWTCAGAARRKQDGDIQFLHALIERRERRLHLAASNGFSPLATGASCPSACPKDFISASRS